MSQPFDPEADRLHRKLNYDLHQGIDLIKLGIVLEDMQKNGVMTAEEAKTYNLLASSVLTAIRNHNNKHFGKHQHIPIR